MFALLLNAAGQHREYFDPTPRTSCCLLPDPSVSLTLKNQGRR